MSQPPPPQLSPDGKYQWNGQQWVPIQQPALPNPAGYAPQPLAVAPVYPTAPQGLLLYRPQTNSLAITSLVFGIISFFLCPLVGSLVAVICGHVAHGQIRRTGESGAGLATAGLILGYINLVGSAVFVFFWIALFGGLAALLAAIGAATPTPSP